MNKYWKLGLEIGGGVVAAVLGFFGVRAIVRHRKAKKAAAEQPAAEEAPATETK